MDFIKILKSFEEFIYEVVAWLVFYPRTLWRVVRHPIGMARYAHSELSDPLRKQFSDAMSPPLFLLLSVVISHIVELMLHVQMPGQSNQLARMIFGSEQNLLLYRTITFGIWALLGSLYLLLRTRSVIDRDTLRAPFYAQSYLVAPFAIALSIGATLARQSDMQLHLTGAGIILVACVWYIAVQAIRLRDVLHLPWWRSIAATGLVLVVGLVINTLVALALLAPS